MYIDILIPLVSVLPIKIEQRKDQDLSSGFLKGVKSNILICKLGHQNLSCTNILINATIDEAKDPKRMDGGISSFNALSFLIDICKKKYIFICMINNHFEMGRKREIPRF